MSVWKMGVLFVLFMWMGGCATVSREAGFAFVEETVWDNAGHEIAWYQSDAEYEEVAGRVQALLSDSLSETDAVEIALLNNRSLQAAYATLGITHAALVQAGLFSNPRLSGHLGYPTSDDHAPDLALGVSINFLDFLFVPLKKAVAASAYEAAQIQLAGEVVMHAGEVVHAFRNAQGSTQLYGMLTEVNLAAETSYEAARLLREAGNTRAIDLNNERLFYEQVRMQREAARLRMVQDRERLNVLMGLWGENTEWILHGRLPNPERGLPLLADIEKRALEVNLDLAMAAEEIELFGRRLELVNATALIPSLELGFEGEREGSWEIGPEVGFPIPLFDQGQARKAGAEAELHRQQASYYALAVEIRSAARVIRERLQSTFQTARHFRDIVLPISSQISAETETLFNAMQVGVFQLIEARRQEIRAGMGYIEALQHFWTTQADYERLLQGKVPLGSTTELHAPMELVPESSSGGH